MKIKQHNFLAILFFHAILLISILVILYPFILMISGSFKTDMELANYPLRIIPENPIFSNYEHLFEMIPFWRQFMNSLLVALTCAFVAMFFNGAVAYGFSRFARFKGKTILFSFLIATILIPVQVYMVPQFQMYNKMKLVGTYWPLIIPSLMNAFGIFLMHQVMVQVPRELYESATIDGYNELLIYIRIAIPLSAAGIGLQGVLIFMNSWNDFMTPLIYLNKEIMYTLPIGLMAVQSGGFKITYGAPLAGAFISCVPIIAILAVVGQKFFVKGLMSGAVKG